MLQTPEYNRGFQDGWLVSRERRIFTAKAASANRAYRGKGHITLEDIVEVVKNSGRTCHWCNKKNLQGRDLTLEHLKPINDKKYLAIACQSCNFGRTVKYGKKRTFDELRQKERDTHRKWVEKNRIKLREYHKLYSRKLRGGLHPRILKTPEELKVTVSAYNRKYLEKHREEIKRKRRERYARQRAIIFV